MSVGARVRTRVRARIRTYLVCGDRLCVADCHMRQCGAAVRLNIQDAAMQVEGGDSAGQDGGVSQREVGVGGDMQDTT